MVFAKCTLDPVGQRSITNTLYLSSTKSSVVRCQLLLNLRQSVKTLDICGEWGSNVEATLEMQSGNVYMQARASQKRLSALQVALTSPVLPAAAFGPVLLRLPNLVNIFA